MKLSAAIYSQDYAPQQILRATAEAGFAACGLSWKATYSKQQWQDIAVKTVRELDLEIDYIHAPFRYASSMWREEEEKWSRPLELLLGGLHACAEAESPVLVVHTYIGFQNSKPVGQAGIDHFGILVQEAEKLGIRIAFENTEGGPYLAALMGAFCREKHVGFCWDSGHELCYNGGQDQMALYGDRLLCTHLNDNLGCHGGPIPAEDLHLLPFDGIWNWQEVADRLDAAGYTGNLGFEILTYSKPGRYENHKYSALSIEDYAKLAYERACRVAALRKG